MRYIILMENVPATAALAVVILASVQSVLVLIRVPGCVHRAEPLLLAASLCLLALLPVVPAHSLSRDALLILLLWTAGVFLRRAGSSNAASTKGRPTATGSLAAWSAANGSILFVLVLAARLGYSSTIPFVVFRATGIGIMGAMVVGTIAGFRGASRSWAVGSVFLACCLWLAAGALNESLLLLHRPSLPGISAWPLLLLVLGTGWLVFQEGYPARPGWRGRLDPRPRARGPHPDGLCAASRG